MAGRITHDERSPSASAGPDCHCRRSPGRWASGARGVLSRWLKGEPPPAWARRPRAKDHLRERALVLRREGRSYGEILAAVPMSRSTLSRWLRDVPLSEEHRAALEARAGSARRRAAATLRAASRADGGC